MLLKTCPMCLGDVTVEGILGDVETRCTMCGYRFPAEARPPGLARNHSPRLTTTAQREWPYPRYQLRPSRA
jgi:hypothetical protein